MSCLLEDAYIIEYLHVFISKQIGCVSHRQVNSLLIKKTLNMQATTDKLMSVVVGCQSYWRIASRKEMMDFKLFP